MKIVKIINEEIESLLDPNNLQSFYPDGYEHNILDETYNSVNEIKELAIDILKKIANDNYVQYNRDKEFKFIFGLKLKNIDSSKYHEIKDFIEKMNIGISLLPKNPNIKSYGEYGNFETKKGEYFNPNLLRDINIYYDYYLVKNSIDEIIKDYGKVGALDVYSKLYYQINSSLVHELQHAYDDYRSNGMAYNTKQFQKFKEKNYDRDAKIARSQMSDLETVKKYLNLPHEIWARFSQAIIKVRFYTMDFDDQGNVIAYKMHPIEDVLKSFKMHYDNFNVLSDDTKKKLYRKVSQFWHYEQERIKNINN
jgi:hypothetical protein